MNTTRTWTAGAAVVAVLLVIAGWFLFISPQRSAAADLRDQTSAREAANEQIALRTKQLQAQFASLPARQAQLAEIKQQMPDNPALPSLIRDLSTFADQAGVSLKSIAPGDPAPVGASDSGPVTAPGAAPAAQSAGLVAIPTTIEASGTYAELTLYLQKLQSQMRRAVLVNDIKLEVNTEQAGAGISMTVTGDIFVMNPDALGTSAPAAVTPPNAASTTPAAN